MRVLSGKLKKRHTNWYVFLNESFMKLLSCHLDLTTHLTSVSELVVEEDVADVIF